MANNKKFPIPSEYIIGIGLIGFLYFAGKGVLSKFGLLPSKNDQEIKQSLSTLANEDYFNPNYYARHLPAKILTVSDGNKFSERIYNAKQLINDDEAAVYGVFQLLRTKTQVSSLANYFQSKYQKSLLGFLQSFLNESELSNIATIINKLPVSNY